MNNNQSDRIGVNLIEGSPSDYLSLSMYCRAPSGTVWNPLSARRLIRVVLPQEGAGTADWVSLGESAVLRQGSQTRSSKAAEDFRQVANLNTILCGRPSGWNSNQVGAGC